MTWTVEQAAELLVEQILELLDGAGADDDDVLPPRLVLEAVTAIWAPGYVVDWPELTVRELRERMRRKRAELAAGERIP